MTHRTGTATPRLPRGWLIPLAVVVLILAAIAGGQMSRAIGADFLAWWPVWVAVVAVGFLGRNARLGPIRIAGLVPVLLTGVLAIFVVAYYLSWPPMPSASISLVGPSGETFETAALSARIDGDIEVSASSGEAIYQAKPLRRGGSIGPPTAVEQVQGGKFSSSLQPLQDSGVYRFAGWSIGLVDVPVWTLALAGSITGDLTPLRITDLHLAGDGQVKLGRAFETATVTIDGDFQLGIPQGIAASVIGTADVPDDWDDSGDGSSAPVEGKGWVFSVAPGASLSVIYS